MDQVLDTPLHPYTSGLIGLVTSRTARGGGLRRIPGCLGPRSIRRLNIG